jgi:hypothetical protein
MLAVGCTHEEIFAKRKGQYESSTEETARAAACHGRDGVNCALAVLCVAMRRLPREEGLVHGKLKGQAQRVQCEMAVS